uniref:Transposase n=1 Tax=Leptobrachium leishanense TaxID=445787 RepID=A0A8C5QII1_9ANUR
MTHRKRSQTPLRTKAASTSAKTATIARFFEDSPTSGATSQKSKMAPAPAPSRDSSAAGSPTPSEDADLSVRDILRSLPTKEDLASLLAKLESSFAARLDAVVADVRHVGARVQDLEGDRETTEDRLTRLETGLNSHTLYLQRFHRALDDQDNRGRRNNLRLRGLPESPDGKEMLTEILRPIFNSLLRRPIDTPIHFDRAHRSLKPKGTPNMTPRDVICRLHYYRQKEDILQAARRQDVKDPLGNALQLYPDLSWHTLQARRLLKPLTEVLRDRQVKYRWGYPFSLQVTLDGVHYGITSVTDLPPLLTALGIESLDIPDWYGGQTLDLVQNQTQPQRPRWQTPSKRGRGVSRSQQSNSQQDPG